MRHKTTVKKFIKYLEDKNLATARLITVLHTAKCYDRFIEDITQREFEGFTGAGKLTTVEFLTLRTKYLELQDEERGYNQMTREDLIERIRELEQQLDFKENILKSYFR